MQEEQEYKNLDEQLRKVTDLSFDNCSSQSSVFREHRPETGVDQKERLQRKVKDREKAME